MEVQNQHKKENEVNDWNIGDSASITKTVTQEMVNEFAKMSEDFNPVHTDDECAKTSFFGRRIAHGLVSAGLFSGLLGTRLPGWGTLYLEQNLRFCAPVYPGDDVTATVTLTEFVPNRRGVIDKARFQTRAFARGIMVIDGVALVKLPHPVAA